MDSDALAARGIADIDASIVARIASALLLTDSDLAALGLLSCPNQSSNGGSSIPVAPSIPTFGGVALLPSLADQVGAPEQLEYDDAATSDTSTTTTVSSSLSSTTTATSIGESSASSSLSSSTSSTVCSSASQDSMLWNYDGMESAAAAPSLPQSDFPEGQPMDGIGAGAGAGIPLAPTPTQRNHGRNSSRRRRRGQRRGGPAAPSQQRQQQRLNYRQASGGRPAVEAFPAPPPVDAAAVARFSVRCARDRWSTPLKQLRALGLIDAPSRRDSDEATRTAIKLLEEHDGDVDAVTAALLAAQVTFTVQITRQVSA